MILPIIIASVTAILMVTVVIVKPYIVKGHHSIGLYWIICLVGALLMIVSGCISLKEVWSGITADTSVNPLKILVLFLSVTLISLYLGDAGFFDYLADYLFKKNKNGQIKLFLALYFLVAILTVFTSNDIIILTFTPPICIFCKRAKISPIPFLFGEFVAANTWSMMLIVGNPTNIYLATSQGITFFEYFSVMWLPAIVGGLTGLAMLLVLFRKSLKAPIIKENGYLTQTPPIKKVQLIVSLAHLGVCIILLAISDFIGFEMWLICLVLFASLFIFHIVYELIKRKRINKTIRVFLKAPFDLIPFILSMFVIVLALTKSGVTDVLSKALVSAGKWDGVKFGFLSAVSANLLNNIPMSVLFSQIVGTSKHALFGTVIGSNVGAFIASVGALAGIMWGKILSENGVKLPFYKFMLYGSAIAVPTILTSSLCLLII